MTGVPTTPDAGDRTRVGVARLNGALPASPLVPVTVTVYEAVAPDATVNEPDITPPANAHTGPEIRPLGEDEIAQLVSAGSNPVPKTITMVPGCPEVGFRVIAGVTKKLDALRSPVGEPVTFKGCTPRVAVDNTWNFPVMTPAEIVHVGEVTTALPVIVQLVSLVLNPVPLTVTHSLRGP